MHSQGIFKVRSYHLTLSFSSAVNNYDLLFVPIVYLIVYTHVLNNIPTWFIILHVNIYANGFYK